MFGTPNLSHGSPVTFVEWSPGDPPPPEIDLDAIYAFLVRPFDPWMAPAEVSLLPRFLKGGFAGDLRHTFFLAHAGGRIVGTAWHGTAESSRETGGYGFVLTDEGHRGRGIAQELTRRSVERFWDEGGAALYLGTTNPVAQHVYAKFGYAPYNGIAMRAIRPGLDPGEFDATYFTFDGGAQIREVTMGDVGAYTALLLARELHSWVIRDFTEGIFYAPPSVVSTSCLRPFYNAMLQHEASPTNVFKALVTQGGRMVAAARAFAPPGGALAGAGILEVQCYPTYRQELPGFLADVIQQAAHRGMRQLRAFAVADDRADALREAGFHPAGELTELLQIGPARASIQTMQLRLAS